MCITVAWGTIENKQKWQEITSSPLLIYCRSCKLCKYCKLFNAALCLCAVILL